MSSTQKVLIGLISVLLFFAITIGVPLIALGNVVGNKEKVKEVLLSDAVYQTIKDTSIQNPSENLSAEEVAQADPVTVDQTAVSEIVNQFLTPEVYTQNVNRLIDGFYAYLDGDSPDVHIELIITNDTANFQNFIVDSFTSSYSELPICDPEAIDPQTYDPLNADCQVSNIDSDNIRALILQNQEYASLLNGAIVITSQQTPAGQEGTTQFGQIDPQNLRSIRNTYQFLQSVKIIFIIATVVLLGLLAAVVHSKQLFRVYGWALMIPTVCLLVGGLLGWLLQRNLINSVSPANTETVRNTFLAEGIGSFVREINTTVLIYSVVLLILSLGCLICWFLLNRNTPKTTVQKINT